MLGPTIINAKTHLIWVFFLIIFVSHLTSHDRYSPPFPGFDCTLLFWFAVFDHLLFLDHLLFSQHIVSYFMWLVWTCHFICKWLLIVSNHSFIDFIYYCRSIIAMIISSHTVWFIYSHPNSLVQQTISTIFIHRLILIERHWQFMQTHHHFWSAEWLINL